jgi:hypothetical protein
MEEIMMAKKALCALLMVVALLGSAGFGWCRPKWVRYQQLLQNDDVSSRLAEVLVGVTFPPTVSSLDAVTIAEFSKFNMVWEPATRSSSVDRRTREEARQTLAEIMRFGVATNFNPGKVFTVVEYRTLHASTGEHDVGVGFKLQGKETKLWVSLLSFVLAQINNPEAEEIIQKAMTKAGINMPKE